MHSTQIHPNLFSLSGASSLSLPAILPTLVLPSLSHSFHLSLLAVWFWEAGPRAFALFLLSDWKALCPNVALISTPPNA